MPVGLLLLILLAALAFYLDRGTSDLDQDRRQFEGRSSKPIAPGSHANQDEHR